MSEDDLLREPNVDALGSEGYATGSSGDELEGQGFRSVFDGDEVRQVLEASFFRGDKGRPPTRRSAPEPEKPQHYKVICISMYNEDLSRLDAKVDELRKAGFRKVNRSALIRLALERLDNVADEDSLRSWARALGWVAARRP